MDMYMYMYMYMYNGFATEIFILVGEIFSPFVLSPSSASFQEGVLELVVSSIQSSWQQAKVRAAGKMEAMIWIWQWVKTLYLW